MIIANKIMLKILGNKPVIMVRSSDPTVLCSLRNCPGGVQEAVVSVN